MSGFCYSQSIIQFKCPQQYSVLPFGLKGCEFKWIECPVHPSSCSVTGYITNISRKCPSFQTPIDKNYVTCSNEYRFTRICVCDFNVKLWLPLCPNWHHSLYLDCSFLHAMGRQQDMCHCWVVVWCQPAMKYPMLYKASNFRYAFECSLVRDTWYCCCPFLPIQRPD
jgi:hypothetical protein